MPCPAPTTKPLSRTCALLAALTRCTARGEDPLRPWNGRGPLPSRGCGPRRLAGEGGRRIRARRSPWRGRRQRGPRHRTGHLLLVHGGGPSVRRRPNGSPGTVLAGQSTGWPRGDPYARQSELPPALQRCAVRSRPGGHLHRHPARGRGPPRQLRAPRTGGPTVPVPAEDPHRRRHRHPHPHPHPHRRHQPAPGPPRGHAPPDMDHRPSVSCNCPAPMCSFTPRGPASHPVAPIHTPWPRTPDVAGRHRENRLVGNADGGPATREAPSSPIRKSSL